MNTSVLISNLAVSIDAMTLEDMFSAVGNVRRATIQTDRTGYAVVEMSTPEEARNCVLHFNGQKKEGQTLIVREDGPPREKVLAQPRSAARKPAFKALSALAKRKQPTRFSK